MELRPTHSDQVLCDLGHTLLAFVDSEIRPINELFIDLEKVRSAYSSRRHLRLTGGFTCSNAFV
jgi:hypothetical protein